MTTKQRITQLEKTAPKPTVKNPYMAMTKKELLQATKSIVENADPVTQEDRALFERAKGILHNNDIAFTEKAVTHDNQ